MKNKRLTYILISVAFLLLIPLIAMQFTDEVNWDVMDFGVAGILLIGTGLVFDFALKRIKSIQHRIVIAIVLLLALILVWAELAVGIFSISDKGKFNSRSAKEIVNNPELVAIYEADQGDRKQKVIDWNVVRKRDSIREARVSELLDSNMLLTSLDYKHAAMVFQHGGDSIAFGMAVKLMRKSIELDSTANKWLLAAAIDRNLLSRKKPQIYGTQYWMRNGHSWEQRDMDTTIVSDAERIEYGVGTLAQQKEKIKRMNKKNK